MHPGLLVRKIENVCGVHGDSVWVRGEFWKDVLILESRVFIVEMFNENRDLSIDMVRMP